MGSKPTDKPESATERVRYPPPESMVDLLVRCSEDELIDLKAALVQRRFRLRVELEQIEQALALKSAPARPVPASDYDSETVTGKVVPRSERAQT